MKAVAAIVLLGGGLILLPDLAAQGCAQETFWHRLSPSVPPMARHGHAMSRDSVLGNAVLFGGRTGDGFVHADTWQWDGEAWIRRYPTNAPAARSGARMVFDAGANRAFLFGGLREDDAVFADTWSWDGRHWTLLHPKQAPEPRCGHGMVFDPKRSRVFLYGGMDPRLDPSHFADTWVWNGNEKTWQPMASSDAPGPRAWHAMAYDPVRDTVVMFGGEVEVAPGIYRDQGDTWVWRDDGWVRLAPATSPQAQHGHAMAWSPERGCIVLFGVDGTWEWSGTEWYPTATGAPVPKRRHHALVHVPKPARVLMFGGQGERDYGDTWEYLSVALDPSYEVLGQGCEGSAGVPTLNAGEGQAPWLGEPFSAVLTNVPPGRAALMVVGFRPAERILVPRKGDISVPSYCMVYVEPAGWTWMVPEAPGRAVWTVTLPAEPAAVGLVFYNQALVLDREANSLGVTASNARAGRIGAVR